VRWLFLVVMLVGSLVSGAQAKPSNPAFLGIEMNDLQGRGGPAGAVSGPCMVTGVTRGSGAKAAGLQAGDILNSIDSASVPNCDGVLKIVQAHAAGDTVRISVLRYGRPLTLEATLVSRDEILRRRFVGQPIGATDVVGVDDQRTYDLGSLRRKTAIVGWFDARRCDGCNTVFTKLANWSRAQAGKPGIQPMPLAVTAGMIDKPPTSLSLDVPLAIADPALYEEFTIPDTERIHFMVVDCHGVVQYVAPIAPNSDDTDAGMDELFAAAEQASRRTSKSSAR
jgi:hypothetical protein